MKPGYWIGIIPILGAILGYALFNLTGWLGAGIGTVLGILVGAVIYAGMSRNPR